MSLFTFLCFADETPNEDELIQKEMERVQAQRQVDASAREDLKRAQNDSEFGALGKLRIFLGNHHYTKIVYKLTENGDPEILVKKIPLAPLVGLDVTSVELERRAESLTAEEQVLLNLFYLGKSIEAEELKKFVDLSAEVVEKLKESQLFEAIGNQLRLKNVYVEPYRLANQNDMYLFSELPEGSQVKKVPTAFISKSSHILLDRLMNDNLNSDFLKSGTGADFGSGIGIQAIALLKKYPEIKKIYALENDAKSTELAKVNAKFNRVEDRFESRKIEVGVDGLEGISLDWAISNPPSLITPDSAKGKLHLYGEGGTNGLDVTSVFIAQAAKHLNEGGSFYFYTQLAKGEDGKTYLGKLLVDKPFAVEFQHLPSSVYNYDSYQYAKFLKGYFHEESDPSVVQMMTDLENAKVAAITTEFVLLKKTPVPSVSDISMRNLDIMDSQYARPADRVVHNDLTPLHAPLTEASDIPSDLPTGALTEREISSKFTPETLEKLKELSAEDPELKNLLKSPLDASGE